MENVHMRTRTQSDSAMKEVEAATFRLVGACEAVAANPTPEIYAQLIAVSAEVKILAKQAARAAAHPRRKRAPR